MAENFILPNSILLTASEIGGTEKSVVCLTQNDFAGTSNNSTIDTFCGTEQLPGSQAQTISGAFRRIWNPDTGRISEAQFYMWWKLKTHIQFSVAPASPGADDLVYTGTGYVTAFSTTNTTNAIPTASMTITCDEPMELNES